ncbi:response regulator [Pelagibius sp. CAU 1746]|uniref:response regulator n=1 Tax=Pelagibius sp. CAU 1746 TaxID=3140370 RepID=UPI00325C1694
MTKQLHRPSVTEKSAKRKTADAEHTNRAPREELIAVAAVAASAPDPFRQDPIAPPRDRALDIVPARIPDRDTAPAFSESIIDAIGHPLVVLDEATCVVLANRAYYRAFNVEPAGIIGHPFASQFDDPAMGLCLERLRSETGGIEDLEAEIDLPLLGHRQLLLSARRLRDASAPTSWILLAIDDVTERNRVNHNLALAKSQAERANRGKSLFLAAASHDLRQPLQTLSLLQGILTKRIKDPACLQLIGRIDETLGVMSGMLNTLLDINQLEAGIVRPEVSDFSIGDLLERLSNDFAGMATSKKLAWRTVASSLAVRSDPRLLEQMLRNLISNALKYTVRGKVLLGCRRRGDMLRIEVWDTGIGIPEHQLQAVFEEFYQLDNPARDRRLGIGLGLSILQRLAGLLDHPIDVQSQSDVGSMFAVSVPIGRLSQAERLALARAGPAQVAPRTGEILIVEDDPSVREMLVLLFEQEGHRTVAAADGHEAFALAARGTLRPDVVVADYNLPLGLTGIHVATALRATLHDEVPVVILTGDISSDTLREISQQNCLYLHKPVKAADLTRLTQSLMTPSRATGRAGTPTASATPPRATVFVVDDDESIRRTASEMLQEHGYDVRTYASSEAFLAICLRDCAGCLVVDARLPEMSGHALIGRLKEAGTRLPAIMITGHGDVPMAVAAMQAGAVDFLEKPVRHADLLASIDRALAQGSSPGRSPSGQAAGERLAGLTVRQQQVMDQVIAGHANKEIAARLGISQRTVENHRAAVMKRTKTKSLPELIRLVMHAG